MKTPHSAAPWTIGHTKDLGSTHAWLSIIAADGQPVCHVCREVGDLTKEDGGVSGANSRMLHAAPDLLAALMTCRSQLHLEHANRYGSRHFETAKAIEAAMNEAQAAIDKALGNPAAEGRP